MTRFLERREAGRMLAIALADHAGRDDVLVLALPRGGVVVGYEVARALRLPLDILVIRKLGVPGREELAMGAVASGGVRVVNRDVVTSFGISETALDATAARKAREIADVEGACRGDAPPLDVTGMTCIVVDDGLATGATMRAGVAALRRRAAASVIAAVPVASREACALVAEEADDFVCLLTPPVLLAIGEWYADFRQTTVDEVRDLLARARAVPPGAAAA
ncbi:MAG: phosphoribosyltransferase [Planctomycetota bacterium]